MLNLLLRKKHKYPKTYKKKKKKDTKKKKRKKKKTRKRRKLKYKRLTTIGKKYMKAQIEALKNDTSLSPEELQKELEKLRAERGKIVDKFWDMLPDSFKVMGGDFGLESLELKVETIWSYIRSKLNGGMTGLLTAAFDKLIGIFSEIWDLLGLPDLPIPLPDLNVESILQSIIDAWKIYHQLSQ